MRARELDALESAMRAHNRDALAAYTAYLQAADEAGEAVGGARR